MLIAGRERPGDRRKTEDGELVEMVELAITLVYRLLIPPRIYLVAERWTPTVFGLCASG